MEPLKPQVVKDLLARPQATTQDIEEYERLLSERFNTDPDLPRSPQEAARNDAREARLKELHQKLYSGAQGLP
jgi:hypothetical protein